MKADVQFLLKESKLMVKITDNMKKKQELMQEEIRMTVHKTREELEY